MTARKKNSAPKAPTATAKPPAPTLVEPTEGGSYTRHPDGTLTRRAEGKPATDSQATDQVPAAQ